MKEPFQTSGMPEEQISRSALTIEKMRTVSVFCARIERDTPTTLKTEHLNIHEGN